MLDGLSWAAEALFSVLVMSSAGWLVVLAGAYALCDHSRPARQPTPCHGRPLLEVF